MYIFQGLPSNHLVTTTAQGSAFLFPALFICCGVDVFHHNGPFKLIYVYVCRMAWLDVIGVRQLIWEVAHLVHLYKSL